MAQRKTQTPSYWQEQFTVSNSDVEFIYNQMLEQNRLFDLDEIALAVVSRHCREEELKTRSELQQGELYQPKGTYKEGETLVFPAFEFAQGRVKYTRAGRHPEYGTFTVIGVAFNSDDAAQEFVADFHHAHTLNVDETQSLASMQGLMLPEELYETYRDSIRPKIKTALANTPDFVEFHDQYTLRDLLVDFHEGLFNIADAAIDINNGPLRVDALIEQMGLAEEGAATDLIRFSVNHRLDNDERFDDVGPTGQILWYLERMEPPEAHHQPRRLVATLQEYDAGLFDEDLIALMADIDDETTHPDDIPAVGPETDSVVVVLNYPHWRVGTLPMTPKTRSFFPSSHYNPVLFQFVDGRTGETFPGWTALENKYVFGLEDWYTRNKLPVGAYITLKRTDDPLRLVVDYQSIRTQRDWVRMATSVNNRLRFQMNKEPIGCKYDELMIIGESNREEIDNLWVHTQSRGESVYDILCHIFPELSKLNPQSTVHAKTLYSATNVTHRVPPGVVFQELVKHDCFMPMRHGYWTYDPNLRD